MRFRPDPCLAHIESWIERQGRQLIADYQEAERFLLALDPTAESFSFRTFSDTPYTRRPGRDPLERAIHGSLAGCWPELLDLSAKGAAVSVTINQTNGKGRGVDDIRRVRALFLDDDDSKGEVDRFALIPQIQVSTSPGRFHHYWLVEELPLTDFASYQRAVAKRYAGDGKVQALNQSMQLPGVWRRKRLSLPRLPAIYKINSIAKYTPPEIENLLSLA